MPLCEPRYVAQLKTLFFCVFTSSTIPENPLSGEESSLPGPIERSMLVGWHMF